MSYWGRGPWSKEVRSDSLGFSKECSFSMLVPRHAVGRFVSQPWQSPPRILALQAPDTCKFVYSSCPFCHDPGLFSSGTDLALAKNAAPVLCTFSWALLVLRKTP